ncbi:MAG: hypothetical protein OEM96_01635, partial [Gemmatimonadota bacterium]|nr:hypothetical protein [Gemmatimonadota bacterium]
RVLGLRLSGEQIVGLLKPLGFEFGDPSADSPEPELRVRIPSWRNDVRREVDLLEEVARLYGYESFPDESRSFRPTTVPDDPMWLRRDRISRLLTARGFLEARGLPMVAARRARADCVKLLNPLSETESVLRTDLVPPLIDRLEHNFSRGHRAIRLFEIGTVFRRLPAVSAESDVRDRYDEEVRVALVMTGASRSEHWSATAEDTDIWDLLGVTEQISDLLPEVVLRPGLPAGETPGFGLDGWLGDDRIAMFDGDALVGVAGAIRSDAVDSPPWAGAAFAAEFRLNAVGLRRGAPFRELPTYPSTRRDLALLVPAGVTASSVEAAIRDAAPTELESLRVFDVYEAAGAADGGRSIAWRLVFRAADRTLTDGEVEACVERIVTKLREELDVRVRES